MFSYNNNKPNRKTELSMDKDKPKILKEQSKSKLIKHWLSLDLALELF